MSRSSPRPGPSPPAEIPGAARRVLASRGRPSPQSVPRQPGPTLAALDRETDLREVGLCVYPGIAAHPGEPGTGTKESRPRCGRFSHSCCSVAQSCPTLCDPMDCSTPGLPGLRHLPGACSNSCTLSLRCRPTISSSAVPFSCLLLLSHGPTGVNFTLFVPHPNPMVFPVQSLQTVIFPGS